MAIFERILFEGTFLILLTFVSSLSFGAHHADKKFEAKTFKLHGGFAVIVPGEGRQIEEDSHFSDVKFWRLQEPATGGWPYDGIEIPTEGGEVYQDDNYIGIMMQYLHAQNVGDRFIWEVLDPDGNTYAYTTFTYQGDQWCFYSVGDFWPTCYYNSDRDLLMAMMNYYIKCQKRGSWVVNLYYNDDLQFEGYFDMVVAHDLVKVHLSDSDIYPANIGMCEPGLAQPEPTTNITVNLSSCGDLIEGANIELQLVPVPGSGGHLHLSPDMDCGHGANNGCGTLDESSGVTDQDGKFETTYTAPELGMEEEVFAKATIDGITRSDNERITIRYPNLSSLNSSDNYFLVPGDGNHVGWHNVNSEAWSGIQAISALWRIDDDNTYDTTISYLDASLPYGGLFDYSTFLHPPHSYHRAGYDIDVRSWFNVEINGYLTRVTLKSELDRFAENLLNVRECHRNGTIMHWRFGGLSCGPTVCR